MIEILVLIFVCYLNGKLAKKKGLPAKTWQLYTVLSWLACEFIAVIIGLMLFGPNNLLGAMMLAAAGGFGGYLIIRARLENMPDSIDKDDIDRIGINDLRPPKQS